MFQQYEKAIQGLIIFPELHNLRFELSVKKFRRIPITDPWTRPLNILMSDEWLKLIIFTKYLENPQ